MRKTIYISERRNKEIADFIKSIPSRDVSYEAVKLMEDGMKWRKAGHNADRRTLEKGSPDAVLLRQTSLPPAEEKNVFDGIKIKRIRPERGELEAKLDSL